jgi:hypothetical protein
LGEYLSGAVSLPAEELAAAQLQAHTFTADGQVPHTPPVEAVQMPAGGMTERAIADSGCENQKHRDGFFADTSIQYFTFKG